MGSKLKFVFTILIFLICLGSYFYINRSSIFQKKIDNYTLIKEIDGDLLNSKVRVYKHDKTQATVVYFYNPNEDNNAFSIGFKTTPFDNTGVFHILEHSVLGGSTKYPLNGTIVFELERSYITTFINALTAPDKTIYPISSTNKTSFRNLSNAYMDAVFSPLVKQVPAIFYREAVRIDFDDKSNFKYNGIVYNEMLANINKWTTLELQAFKNLLPNSGYSYNSGGDPEFIPDLTYEKFIETYNKFYHPSNSLIFFYGNVDLEERLTYLDQNYLSQYEYQQPPESSINTIEDNPNPEPVVDYYPADPQSKVDEDSSIIFGYIANFESIQDKTALGIILDTIFNSESSSYRKELLSKCNCKSISATMELLQKPIFYIHVEGVSPKALSSIKESINNFLQKISKNGLDKDTLLSIISNHLFNFKSINSSNLGLDKYITPIYDSWMVTQDPLSYLNEDKIIENLQKISEKDTSYFTTVLNNNFITNNKKYIGIISPSTTFLPEKQKRIASRLKQEVSKLTDSDKTQIKQINDNIKELASSTSSFKLTPLSEEDLVKKDYKFALLPNKETIKLNDSNITLFSYDSLYDDIDHVYLMFGLSHLSDEDFLNLSLLNTLLQRIPTENYSSEELNQAIDRYGRLSTSINYYIDKDKKYHFYYKLTLDSLPTNINSLLDLGLETLYNTTFTDKDKIKQILNETLYNMEQYVNINPLNLGYLSNLATSSLSSSCYINNYVKGKYFIKRLKTIVKDFDANFDSLVNSLKAVSNKVFTSNIPMIAVVSKSDVGISNLKNELLNKTNKEKLLSYMKLTNSSSLNFGSIDRKDSSYQSTGYIIPQNTSYSITSFDLSNIDPSIKITGDYWVLDQYIQKYLMDKIRLEAGAYGANLAKSKAGIYVFYSYRDPNISNTNNVFKNVVDILKKSNLEEQDEFMFKVATISEFEQPLIPQEYSISSIERYLSNETEDDVYTLRNEILNTSLNQFVKDKAELFEKAIKTSKFSTAAGKDMLDKNKNLYNKIVPIIEE